MALMDSKCHKSQAKTAPHDQASNQALEKGPELALAKLDDNWTLATTAASTSVARKKQQQKECICGVCGKTSKDWMTGNII